MEGGGELPQALLEGRAALGGGLPRDRGVVEEAGDVRAVLREGLQHGVAVARQAGELLVLLGEDGEDTIRLAEGRIGAVDDLAEVLAAARRGPRRGR